MRIPMITAMADAIPQMIHPHGGPAGLFRFRSFSSSTCDDLASSPNAKLGDWLRNRSRVSVSCVLSFLLKLDARSKRKVVGSMELLLFSV